VVVAQVTALLVVLLAEVVVVVVVQAEVVADPEVQPVQPVKVMLVEQETAVLQAMELAVVVALVA
jgi:hypothetical protein